ncbi:Cof-type HAD-IIB family hydrolase [Streptococcus loxodontisalivarius]|uniref:Cof subfamily protein (Haloacid dehalogenase superfamily) n=1 Tax=Streptococcus loxodontisalivarius TaxID=1349415 RepID=A0ABS2PU98_9STRE|nr:Cof-type HAD-IIB family hydrolase [Streptococcus loxodontisalivarius]MBM7643638.1 Cof subfamily protein (haloacid dehalogenase superfamily) [Streptococcus loxodontisalivarius]
MTDIKILALDLDGTLFNGKKVVTDENKAALKAAREAGVKVVITTGRPLPAIGNLLEELDLISEEDYSITFNGGLVQRNTGQILDKSEMTRQNLADIYAVMEPLGLPIDILSDGIVYSLASQGNHSLYHTANPMLTFVEVDHFDDIPTDIVYNKVVIVTDAAFLDQQIEKLPADLYDQFEVFKSRDIILEIMPQGVHKAVGLDLLTKHLGLSAANVMAMGDEANDLSMLEWAGLGVAMANGTAEVKSKADAVTTKTNEESGVAEAIHRYILKDV